MLQLALKLSTQTTNEKKTLGRSLKEGLTNAAASFPNPKITPEVLEAAVKAVEDQEVLVGTAEDELSEQREALQQKVAFLEATITQSATDSLNTVSLLPEAEAKAALMAAYVPLRGAGVPAQPVPTPQNLVITQGDHSGEVDGACHRSKGAIMYRVRVGATTAGPFETKYEGTKSSFTIGGLPVGDCWFQMAAFGTNSGWSEWSDPARCHVI